MPVPVPVPVTVTAVIGAVPACGNEYEQLQSCDLISSTFFVPGYIASADRLIVEAVSYCAFKIQLLVADSLQIT